MGNVKQAAVMKERMRELMKLKPAPLTYFDVLSTFSSFTILHGLPEAPKLLADVVKECEDRAANGISGIKEEKYRIYWIGAMYWSRLGWMAEKMAKLGINVLSGTYDYIFYAFPEEIDPDKPLESLAYQPISCGYNTDAETLSRMCDWRIAKDLDIDGIVVWEAHTCRVQSGTNHDRADYLAKRLGVPVTFVQGDFVDDAFFSEAQFDTRIQGLLEVIDARRKAK
jgi:benzoyl-CoA reductase/2-hydroxyglutaryl-CoA dehydratase subunit BcrC/BadD/HgdB